MRAHRLTRVELAAPAIAGRVLSRYLRGEQGAVVVRKGEILQPDHPGALQQLDWRELHLIEVEASDLHEDAAGQPEWFTSGPSVRPESRRWCRTP